MAWMPRYDEVRGARQLDGRENRDRTGHDRSDPDRDGDHQQVLTGRVPRDGRQARGAP